MWHKILVNSKLWAMIFDEIDMHKLIGALLKGILVSHVNRTKYSMEACALNNRGKKV